MAETVKPVFTSEFPVPDEGEYLFMVESVEFEEGEKGLLARVRSTIQESLNGAEANVGMTVFDNFPLYVKFGVARFLGFLVKSIGIPEKDYPLDYFENEKARMKVEKQLPGTVFAGKVKHVEGQKGIMANITEYYTKDEYMKKMKSGKPESAKEASEENGW